MYYTSSFLFAIDMESKLNACFQCHILICTASITLQIYLQQLTTCDYEIKINKLKIS